MTRRLRFKTSISLLLASLMLSACGQTGPLYFRDQVPDSQKPPSQRNKDKKASDGEQPSAPPADATPPATDRPTP